MVYLTRVEHFNAAHKLHNENWSDEKNLEVFGKCANPNWHGHNYELFVTIKGEPHPETGFVFNAKELGALINRVVVDKVDHRNLNLDVPEFADLNPTAENIAIVIWNKIRPRLAPDHELEITLFETPRNSVTYRGK